MYFFKSITDKKKIENDRYIAFLQKLVELEGKNQHSVINNANTSIGLKIPAFLEKDGR